LQSSLEEIEKIIVRDSGMITTLEAIDDIANMKSEGMTNWSHRELLVCEHS